MFFFFYDHQWYSSKCTSRILVSSAHVSQFLWDEHSLKLFRLHVTHGREEGSCTCTAYGRFIKLSFLVKHCWVLNVVRILLMYLLIIGLGDFCMWYMIHWKLTFIFYLQVLDALQGEGASADVIAQVNSSLLTLTTLYEKFAEPWSLWECKLAIVHCAGHSEPQLVQVIWDLILP